MLYKKIFLFALCLFLLVSKGESQVEARDRWWLDEPYRLIQTNLREIDARDFDPEVYIASLKDIGANTVLINVGGIVANYYTGLEFHYQNPNLSFDMIEEIVSRLHKEGIRVIGRFDFSKLNETLAVKHPEWLYLSLSGEHVNYNGQVHTCVNGGYQQEYSLKILDEALSRFPLDGVFFNMIGYQTRDYSHHYHGICQSEACSMAFRSWSGGLDLPRAEDMHDPVFRQYQKFKAESTSGLFHRIHDLIKSHGEHIAINTYTHAGTDFYRRESNSHAALYDDFVPWEFQSAHNVKSALGSWKDMQVSNAAVHFYGYPARHSADASWLTRKRLVQNMINGAGVDFYCIGRLDNLEDREVLGHVKEVFWFHKAHEEYLHHCRSGSRILLLHDGQSEKEYQGFFELLTEQHVFFDVMEHWCITREDVPRPVEDYELLILPDIGRLSQEECERLDAYVHGGGKLLVSGFSSTRDAIGNPMDQIRLKSLGVEASYTTFEKEQGTYFRIFEEDKLRLGGDVLGDLDLVYAWERGLHCKALPGTESFLGFIPPAMIGPPEKCYYTEVTDIPGLFSNAYGKGSTAFLSFNIGRLYHHKRHYGHAELIMRTLTDLLDVEGDLQTNASPLVEISRQLGPDGSFEWLGLLNHCGQMGNGFHAPLPTGRLDMELGIKTRVKSVRSLRSGKELEFMQEMDKIVFSLPSLGDFDVVLLEYQLAE